MSDEQMSNEQMSEFPALVFDYFSNDKMTAPRKVAKEVHNLFRYCMLIFSMMKTMVLRLTPIQQKVLKGVYSNDRHHIPLYLLTSYFSMMKTMVLTSTQRKVVKGVYSMDIPQMDLISDSAKECPDLVPMPHYYFFIFLSSF